LYPEPIQNLIDIFAKFPGVGPRQAARFVFYLLDIPANMRNELAKGIAGLADLLLTCSRCGNIEAERDLSDLLCSICLNLNRDQKRIAVVEEVIDLRAIERTHIYNGLYHVLAGNIIGKRGAIADVIPVKKLIARIRKESPEEVIIATSPTYEGDATGRYIERELAPLGVKITRLARGLSKGVDLEYVDEETLCEALAGRR